ncbi:MAG: fumarylacetoacetate hydrolase family protein [Desulfobacca sp.]|uniref:fumarylacetoacetate hydrolase family protein n=1 Tax=Desulfobacca sp. TaxID=2067990 RepID=UPI00404AE98C
MRFVRYLYEDQSHYGLLAGEEITPLAGPPFTGLRPSGTPLPLAAVQLLAPCEPSKIIALGLNYRDHAAEMRLPLPDEPLIFLKPATSVIGPGAAIVLPAQSRRVDYEAELAVVLGRVARKVAAAAAHDYIWGYTCCNDVTARDLQKKDGQFTRSKSFDTFAPLGPWIETSLPAPAMVTVEAYVNGQRRQHSHMGNLVFDVPTLVSFISHIMTLLPGDVIATGTPAGVGPLQPGDVVEIRLGGIGSLENPVISDADSGNFGPSQSGQL